MQLHSFERRNSYIFFAILNQTHELFFAPPGTLKITARNITVMFLAVIFNVYFIDFLRHSNCFARILYGLVQRYSFLVYLQLYKAVLNIL